MTPPRSAIGSAPIRGKEEMSVLLGIMLSLPYEDYRPSPLAGEGGREATG